MIINQIRKALKYVSKDIRTQNSHSEFIEDIDYKSTHYVTKAPSKFLSFSG